MPVVLTARASDEVVARGNATRCLMTPQQAIMEPIKAMSHAF